MDYRLLARNAGTAFLAQGVAFALSIIQTLMVPKLLGTTEYGYWQLFIFYTSYIGFAYLGLNDGVYLIKGGQSREFIDKRSVNSQFVFGCCLNLVFAVVIVAVACLGGFGPDREFVIVCTGIYLVVQNTSSFLMYLLQAMNETRKSSYATIVERLTFLVPLVLLLIFRYRSYDLFVLSYIFSSLVQLGFCTWHCRDFLHAGLKPVPYGVKESLASMRVGIKLMLANIASMLVLGIARFAIDATWGIDTFGELSFALSMVNFFLAFVSQASMVLFPALRQVDIVEVKGFFAKARDGMSILFPAIYAFYYPMVWLLSLWLPKYTNSFIFFVFLIPICVFDSKMNICCTTFFKVLREEGRLLWINVWTCVASAVLTLAGVLVFDSIFMVIGGVVVTIIGRSIWSEERLTRELKVPTSYSLMVGELLLTLVFVATALTLPLPVAFGAYCIAYAVFLILFRRETARLWTGARRALQK
jgi:O-antigen/teichoic acid export membrane protein